MRIEIVRWVFLLQTSLTYIESQLLAYHDTLNNAGSNNKSVVLIVFASVIRLDGVEMAVNSSRSCLLRRIDQNWNNDTTNDWDNDTRIKKRLTQINSQWHLVSSWFTVKI